MAIRQKFRNAIRRGTGETHILIKENPKADFSREIIEAALFNFAYDQQSEGSRHVYIAELIDLSGKKDKVLQTLYQALKNGECRDHWSTVQLFDIIAVFAKRGDSTAKRTVYECFERSIETGNWFGDEVIVELDGLKGLLYVADKKGEYLLKHSDEWEDSFFVDSFLEDNPGVDAYGGLEKAAISNPNVRKYLDEIKKTESERAKRVPRKYDYQYFREKIEQGKNIYLSSYIAGQIPKSDLKKLAADFLKEKKRIRQEKYLHIFSRVKFPDDYHPILNLAKGVSSKTDRLIEFAVEALAFFKGPDIREFALEILPITKTPQIYTSLLVGNYKKGDYRLLRSIAEKKLNIDAIHTLAISYIDIYETNSTAECREPLEKLYDKLTCGLHRLHLVRILIENNVLSEKIRNEIRFDSEELIRNLLVEVSA